jgi:hypothetical protein
MKAIRLWELTWIHSCHNRRLGECMHSNSSYVPYLRR